MPKPRAGSASFWRGGGAAVVFIVRSPLAIFLLYSTAFVTALFALYGLDIQDLAYLHSRQTNLWRMITALMPTAWVLTLAILLGDFERSRAAWPRTRRARMTAVLCVLLGLPVTVLPLVAQYIAFKEEPLMREALVRVLPTWGLLPRLIIANTLGLTSALLLLCGFFGVHTQLIERLRELRHPAGPPRPGSLDEARPSPRPPVRSRRRPSWAMASITQGSSPASICRPTRP